MQHNVGTHQPQLVLLRHGESTANAAGVFTGVWDVPLTARGRGQARRAASLLVENHVVPDLVIASPLLRAKQTIEVFVAELGCSDVTQVITAALTERGYGILTGREKTAVSQLFGADRARLWRRSLTERPPGLSEHAGNDAWAACGATPDGCRPIPALSAGVLAAADISESLMQVIARVRAWHDAVLLPSLRTGASVLTVAHGNSLRALVSILDALEASQIEDLNIPMGEPLRYCVSDRGVPLPGSGRYLDPEAAEVAVKEVALEGGT